MCRVGIQIVGGICALRTINCIHSKFAGGTDLMGLNSTDRFRKVTFYAVEFVLKLLLGNDFLDVEVHKIEYTTNDRIAVLCIKFSGQ